jgi:uncharacterized SAM-binding protein YcdF (DUF218 family)
MFFILSKTAAFLLFPSNILIVCGLAGVVLLLTRRRRLGAWLAGGSLVVMALVSFLPVGATLLWSLESRFPPWDASRGAPDGIIVLGGAINPRNSKVYETPTVTSDAGRLVAMAKLARAYPNARIVYSAGDASLMANRVAEAQFVPPLLDSLGLPRERVILESASRNTAENAALTKQLVQPKPGERWLLVTSAFHMPRAVGCFRKIGFPVEAYPAQWRTLPKWSWSFGVEVAAGLGSLDLAAHEWLGLIAYRLTGKTDTLLPGP